MTSRSSGPDVIVPVSTLGDIESRVGIPSIESLLAERDTLVREVATLRARHGSFGMYNDQRKVLLAQLSATLRAKAIEAETKVTEASLEEASHAHPDYIQWLAGMLLEKAQYFELENRIEGIGETIRRGDVIGRYLTAEIGLSR
jgi:hypothetical protein